MATLQMDEIRVGYISAMGEELGSNFYELYRKLVELHILWQQYCQLFGEGPDVVDLLNRTAGLFFKIVQNELWDSVLLGISRMTDPAINGANKNLTIQSLPHFIRDPTLRVKIQEFCTSAISKAEFARKHRNKRIAHQDHNYLSNRSSNPLVGISKAHVETMLAELRVVMNCIDNHFRGSTVMYERFIDDSGAQLLLKKLRKFERLQASR